MIWAISSSRRARPKFGYFDEPAAGRATCSSLRLGELAAREVRPRRPSRESSAPRAGQRDTSIEPRDPVYRVAPGAAVGRVAADLEAVLLQALERGDLGPLRPQGQGEGARPDVQGGRRASGRLRPGVEGPAQPAGLDRSHL